MSKYILWAIAFLLLLDCASTIGIYLANKEQAPKIVEEKTWQEVCLDAGIDTNTVGTTTDPEDL